MGAAAVWRVGRRSCAVLGALVGSAVAVQAPPAVAAVGLAGSPIRHVVMIYQENHSFDETLGAVCRSRPTPCDGFTGTVTLSDGTPYKMRVSSDVVPLAAHFAHAQGVAVDGGRMDGFDKIGGCTSQLHRCISYYKPQQIPNLAALGDQFVISDRTFEMAQSPSWGGHIYPVAGTLDGFTGDTPLPAKDVTHGPGWGCDANRVANWTPVPGGVLSKVPSCIPFADGSGAFGPTPVPHVPTIFDRLEPAGRDWKLYGQPQPLGGEEAGGFAGGYIWSICPNFADCLETQRASNMQPTTSVLTDAQNGTLPSFSIVTPSGYSDVDVGTKSSQHNGTSMMAGDNWIGQVVSAIQHGPDWNSTAIFITYDDCGCFYDHVPPPGANPDGTATGVRIPMVIVSPWAKPGWTDSNVATLPSVLAFTEHVFGLAPLGVNDAAAYDYADSFDLTQPPQRPTGLADHHVPQTSRDYVSSLPADFWDQEDAYSVPSDLQAGYERYAAAAGAAGTTPVR